MVSLEALNSRCAYGVLQFAEQELPATEDSAVGWFKKWQLWSSWRPEPVGSPAEVRSQHNPDNLTIEGLGGLVERVPNGVLISRGALVLHEASGRCVPHHRIPARPWIHHLATRTTEVGSRVRRSYGNAHEKKLGRTSSVPP